MEGEGGRLDTDRGRIGDRAAQHGRGGPLYSARDLACLRPVAPRHGLGVCQLLRRRRAQRRVQVCERLVPAQGPEHNRSRYVG